MLNITMGGVTALFLFFTAYKKNDVARKLTHLAVADVSWAATHLIAQNTADADFSLLMNKLSVLFIAVIAYCSIAFSILAIRQLTGKLHKGWLYFSQIAMLFFVMLISADIVANTELLINQENYARAWGSIWPGRGVFFDLFPVYFIGSFVVSFFLLSKTLSRPEINIEARKKIQYFNLSLFMASFGGIPYWINWYDIYIPPLGGFFIPLYIFGLFFSITKFHLFNVRVVTAELFIITVWMLMFGRIPLVQDNTFILFDIGIFILTVIFGLLTIQSVIEREQQRERLKLATVKFDRANRELSDLNKNLHQKVKEKKEKVYKAYEIEKEARIELEKLDRAKDNFLLTTQHHLRTPLTVVNGYLDVILGEEKNPKIHSYMVKATQGVKSMIELVNGFLNVSQLEIGKAILNPQPTHISDIVSEIQNELHSIVERKKLFFTSHFSEDAQNAKVAADRKMIKASLYNIIDNAIKYTQKGGITVTGEMFIHPIEKSKILRLKIKDTGMGVKKENLKGVFEKILEREAEAKKANRQGKGIGLVLAKNMIQAHHGNIFVDSEGVGKGTTFTVEIPVEEKML
ncbi:MAG: hypothetical protein KAR00_02590 [Candidatus Pacebacteria bacterium]|nr:hypothetical protein [Candidatus Paceibacterota bacterium]